MKRELKLFTVALAAAIIGGVVGAEQASILVCMAKRESTEVLSLIRGMLALREKTGRDLAIVGASWLEVVVEQNLRENMVVHSGKAVHKNVFDRVLQSSEGKIWVADAFGLISTETRNAALLINRVRNEFAHTIEDITCDSAVVASRINEMSLTVGGELETLKIDKSAADVPVRAITFDGERFDVDRLSGIFDLNPARVYFFLPELEAVSNDDRLRNHIYACALGMAGLGLKPWLERELPNGLPGVDFELVT